MPDKKSEQAKGQIGARFAQQAFAAVDNLQDTDFTILCVGFRGCCDEWRKVKRLPDDKLGEAMVEFLDSSGHGTRLTAAEKRLVKKWPVNQLRSVIDTIVYNCDFFKGKIDPFLTKVRSQGPRVTIEVRKPKNRRTPIRVFFRHPRFEV